MSDTRLIGPRRMMRALGLLLPAGAVACGSSDWEVSERPRVEPNEWLPGGNTTNTLLLGANAFTMPASNISEDHEPMFYSGNSFFNQAWVEAPSSTDSRDGLGPLFNARSCAACHFKDGRGRPPMFEGEAFESMLFRLSAPGTSEQGGPVPEAHYGGQFQPFAIPDVKAEGVAHLECTEVNNKYPDGESYTLLWPTYSFRDLAYGEMDGDTMVSPRVAPSVIGLGLLSAIPETRLAELEDVDDGNGDGISGKMNRVWDAFLGEMAIGRFGWKAEQPNVRQQVAAAFLGDMGITTTLFSAQDCSAVEGECQASIAGGEPEISDHLLDRVEVYSLLLAVPVRETWDSDGVLSGKKLFQDVGCAGCHVPRHETGTLRDVPEVSEQTIWPYTDLLLHDMGEDLSDGRPSYQAEGREWRTPPLWGLRFYRIVNDHDRLLHDGRARGVAEAILWHGGEAESSRERFRSLTGSERRALIDFVESL